MRKFELVKDAPKGAVLPTRKTKGSAGYDFYIPHDLKLPPHSYSPLIKTGVKAYMPEDEVLLLYIRSSVALRYGIVLANGTGVIDSDYVDNPANEGDIGLVLFNNSAYTVNLNKGERIMQGVFVKYHKTDDDKTEEERKGGTGSTGK
jgi:dUTP pyrophosphatase